MYDNYGGNGQTAVPMYGATPQYGNLQAVDFNGKVPFVGRAPRKSVNLVAVVTCLLLPILIFVVVFAAQSFELHYEQPRHCLLLCGGMLVAVFIMGYFAYSAVMQRTVGVQEPMWYVVVFASGFLAWILAFGFGQANFEANMQPFYDTNNLNVYQSVNPATAHGSQMMDAGRIMFTPDSHLDLVKAMVFQNVDRFCVAPISVGPSGPNATKFATYDFWAVGQNCCPGNPAEFRCGEYSNTKATSGLRLMREEERAYYRLAVQQAEAAYNIRAQHPVFLYWLQDANAELFAYEDDGFKYFLLGSLCFSCFQLFVVVVATIAFSKTSL